MTDTPQPPSSNAAVVIGGGRWGRVIADKLNAMGFDVHVATSVRCTASDIAREQIAVMKPAPRLIYVASKSADHERDFRAVAALRIPVWVEKNFHGASAALGDLFLSGQNGLFNQQLFNASLDQHAHLIRGLPALHISTDIEKPARTPAELFDWIGHDLSLVARALWLQDPTAQPKINGTLRFTEGGWTADYLINGVNFRVEIKKSDVRRRKVFLADGAMLMAGRDGVLHLRQRSPAADAAFAELPAEEDLLGAALKMAFETPREDVRRLTELALQLQCATFPLIEKLPTAAFL